MTAPKKTVRKTKSATVNRMLRRDKGATLAEIERATSWKPHSCRAFLSGVRKQGIALAKEELEVMSPAQLRAAWREQFRKPAPEIGPGLLRRGLAWQIQARVHGGLPTSTSKAIDRACSLLEQTGSVMSERHLAIKPGTRLVREWHGKPYHVLVLDECFEHEGRRYESLSQIARAITGAHWSGPRFFGLRLRSRSTTRGTADG